jgi:hypothetical protein
MPRPALRRTGYNLEGLLPQVLQALATSARADSVFCQQRATGSNRDSVSDSFGMEAIGPHGVLAVASEVQFNGTIRNFIVVVTHGFSLSG